MSDFDNGGMYSDNPWQGIQTNQRQWYDPILRDAYRAKNVFGQFTTFSQSLADNRSKTMTITSLHDIHPNTDPLGLRQLWMPAAHVDSRSLDITFSR